MDKKTVLIIDDDQDIVEALERKLESKNLAVIKEFDGEKGLELAFRSRPDMIILDLIIPKIEGLTVLRKIREDHWGKNVPIMILTNISENEKLAKALEIGIDDYKVKSDIQLKEVKEIVDNILGVE